MRIGIHRAIELEELRIPLERIGKDAVSSCIALASGDFGITLRLGNDLHNLSVGACANTLRRLTASCAKTLGFGETLCLHAIIGLLGHLGGQIGATDTDILDLQTQRRCIGAQLVTHLPHHRCALFGERCLEATHTINTAQSCIETGAQPLLGQIDATRNRGPEHARIADAERHERVHFVELTACDLHADVIEIKPHHAILDDLNVVSLEDSERSLEVDSRLAFHVHDLTEAKHDGLLTLVHDENGRIQQQKRCCDDDDNDGKTI